MSIVEQVPRWLHNAEVAPFLMVNEAYTQLMENWFHEWMEDNATPEIRYMYESISRMDKTRHTSFLLAPRTYNVLSAAPLHGSISHEESVRHTLVAEYYICHGTAPVSVTGTLPQYWTSLADFCIVPSTAEIIRQGQYYGGVFMDGTSPYNRVDHDLGQELALQYDPGDLTALYKAIGNTISYIKHRAPALGTLVTRFLRSIGLQYMPKAVGFFSGSRSTYIGLAGLVNLHCADVYDLADALIHESVHSLLYTVELFEGFYNDTGGKAGLAVTSPWSGRSLELHSFTHACFVWYALTCFWSRYRDESHEAEQKYQRARCGFMNCDLTAPLIGYVSGDMINAVRHMQDHVKRGL